jgi:hypothetical protein
VTKRGPKKPAREMTTEEAAERLFGKRVKRLVDRELDFTQVPEKKEKSEKKPSTKREDT